MGYQERQGLIRQIETLRESRVITLVTGDRNIAQTQIADDCLKPLYDLLVGIRDNGCPNRIDLFLETRGGSVETPWKLVNKIRQFCNRFTVIIPWKAYSAGTMICLGSDEILMSPMSELGPIDPWLQIQGLPLGRFLIPDLGVEDVAAYVTFLQQRAGLTDQSALAETIKVLSEHLTPTLLGRMERIYSHIRLVARKLLSLSNPPIPESTVSAIVDALAQKMFAHGHGIGLAEAKAVGLNAIDMGRPLEKLSWELYLDYEKALNLTSNPDARTYFKDDATNVNIEKDAIGAFLESTSSSYVFQGDIKLERIRKMPPQLNINLNLPINLPPGMQPQQLTQSAQLQTIIQQIIQQVGQQIERMVREEIAKQAPVEGIQQGWYGAQWKKLK